MSNRTNQVYPEDESVVFDYIAENPDTSLAFDENDGLFRSRIHFLESLFITMQKMKIWFLANKEDDTMAKLVWDKSGQREFEAGTKNCVLYTMGEDDYNPGVAWNGITAITENPGGAEVTDLYADDMKYASLRAAETFACTIEAFMYPDEWNECDGSLEAASGVFIGQQSRKPFGLVYISSIGDDQHPGMDKGHKLHIIYNCSASPSSRNYTTINENPDAISFSWEATSTPVECTNHKNVSTIIIDSTKADAEKLKKLEDLLFGVDADAEHQIAESSPTLPKPDDVLKMF